VFNNFTATGSFQRRPEFKAVPTFAEMLGQPRPAGNACAAYVASAGSDAVGRFLRRATRLVPSCK
jgi:hypothetical protein